MEERLDDAIHVLRHHAGEPQMAGLAAAAVGGGGGGHQNLSMMHSGGNHPNGMSGMSSYSGMGGISSHVDQMVRGSVIREREKVRKKKENEERKRVIERVTKRIRGTEKKQLERQQQKTDFGPVLYWNIQS